MPLSTNSGLTTVEMEAGEIPRTWEGFLEAGLRDKRWIDGLSLTAAAKRYGVHIIVVPFGYADAQPVCFGAPKAARDPVVLLLRSHDTLGKLKEGMASRMACCRAGQRSGCALPCPRGSLKKWRQLSVSRAHKKQNQKC